MFTVEYKPGWFIHGYFDRPECYWLRTERGCGVYGTNKARTFIGAQRAISKQMKELK